MPGPSVLACPTRRRQELTRRKRRFRSRAVPLTAATFLLALGVQAIAAAPSDAFTPSEPCVVSVLPEKFVESSTTGSIAAVIEVSCEGALAGSTVVVAANELRSRCRNHLSWVLPYPYESISAQTVEVRLDASADATVAVFGDECAAGESTVAAHLQEEPFYTATTSFDVLSPREAEGAGEGAVHATPETEVPNFAHTSIATVVSVAYEPGLANQRVEVTSQELYSRCEHNLVWVGPGGSVLGSGVASSEVQLDYEGRAWVAALAGECAAGESLISAKLEASPFSTVTSGFDIEEQPSTSPVPRVTTVTPDEGPDSGGSTVTITGSHLKGATRVRFGTAEAPGFTVDGESQIEAVVPPGSGSVAVTVTTPVGTSQRGETDFYQYLAPPPPTVTRVRRKHGPPAGGTEVTVTGEDFVPGATTVSFGNTVAPHVTVHSAESLTATAPAGRGRVDVTVTTPGGTSAVTRVDRFKYR